MNSIAVIGGADGPTTMYLTGGDFGLFEAQTQLPAGTPFDDPQALMWAWFKVQFFGAYGIALVLMVLLAYFMGNISPSILIAKAKGIDIKQEGSGNAGTTNALRVMGKKAGVITLVVDILKGTAAVLLGGFVCGGIGAMLCVAAVLCGHVWPVFFKFKGGKGVATGFGALMGLNPLLGLSALGVVIIVVLLTKRMSAGSIAGAISFPILSWFLEPPFVYLAILLALIIIVKHRANVVRLVKGEEPKLSIFDKEKKK